MGRRKKEFPAQRPSMFLRRIPKGPESKAAKGAFKGRGLKGGRRRGGRRESLWGARQGLVVAATQQGRGGNR